MAEWTCRLVLMPVATATTMHHWDKGCGLPEIRLCGVDAVLWSLSGADSWIQVIHFRCFQDQFAHMAVLIHFQNVSLAIFGQNICLQPPHIIWIGTSQQLLNHCVPGGMYWNVLKCMDWPTMCLLSVAGSPFSNAPSSARRAMLLGKFSRCIWLGAQNRQSCILCFLFLLILFLLRR